MPVTHDWCDRRPRRREDGPRFFDPGRVKSYLNVDECNKSVKSRGCPHGIGVPTKTTLGNVQLRENVWRECARGQGDRVPEDLESGVTITLDNCDDQAGLPCQWDHSVLEDEVAREAGTRRGLVTESAATTR